MVAYQNQRQEHRPRKCRLSAKNSRWCSASESLAVYSTHLVVTLVLLHRYINLEDLVVGDSEVLMYVVTYQL